MAEIRVTPTISIDDSEITESFVRAAGPGGQNVNKTSTAVQLRFDVAGSPSLPEEVRHRLMGLAGGLLTEEGVLVITARSERSQLRNRQEALDRLLDLIRRAAERPRHRKRTRPSRASVERRLEEKRHRAERKRERRWREE